MRILVLLVSLGSTCVYGDDAQEYVDEYSIHKDAIEFVQECGTIKLSSCLKQFQQRVTRCAHYLLLSEEGIGAFYLERVLRYIDCLPHNLDLGGGLTIRANDDQENDRTSRQHAEIVFSDDPKAREEALDNALMETLRDYAKSHTLEFRFLKESEKDLNESLVEGRKKKGGGGGGLRLRPMMMLLQLKAVAIGAIALKFIALVAFKALLVAKVALVIAGIVALKKLVEQKHHSSTYEVVSHPHYDDHSHFDRSFNQYLAYKGYDGARKSN